MKFIVQKTQKRPWPVTVLSQVCDAQTGNVVEQANKFIVYFGPFSVADVDKLRESANLLHPAPDGCAETETPLATILARNAEILPQLIDGWGPEVTDESGVPMPYSPMLLAGMITGPDGLALSIGLWHAVQQKNLGIPPAKNVLTSPEPGLEHGAAEAPASTNLPPT